MTDRQVNGQSGTQGETLLSDQVITVVNKSQSPSQNREGEQQGKSSDITRTIQPNFSDKMSKLTSSLLASISVMPPSKGMGDLYSYNYSLPEVPEPECHINMKDIDEMISDTTRKNLTLLLISLTVD